MKMATDETLGDVRENYILVNKSSLLSLAKIVVLCLLANIKINTKTEIKPI